MNAQHTPGRRLKPYQGRWAVYGPIHPTDGGDYAPLAVYADESEARLSVAAPKLLAALRGAQRRLSGCISHGSTDDDFRAIELLARTAIAEAEGAS